MYRNIVKVLLIGGLCFFTTSLIAKEITLTDRMVFKISDTVFSLKDLQRKYKEIQSLSCIYEDSLLVRIFEKEFDKKYSNMFEVKKKFSKDEKNYYLSLIGFTKLLIYSKSQNVVVDPNVIKFFYVSAKRNKCSLDGFVSGKEFDQSFNEIVRLEVFVRSRFLPTEKSGRSTKDDFLKAINTSKNLLKSISKQIDEEVYW